MAPQVQILEPIFISEEAVWMRDAVEVTIANILLSPLRFAVAIGQRNE